MPRRHVRFAGFRATESDGRKVLLPSASPGSNPHKRSRHVEEVIRNESRHRDWNAECQNLLSTFLGTSISGAAAMEDGLSPGFSRRCQLEAGGFGKKRP